MSAPTKAQIRRWRRYLADEIAEGAIYEQLAERKTGEEREILLDLATAEKRHEEHWRDLLGEHANNPPPTITETLAITFLGSHLWFGVCLGTDATCRDG